MRIIIEVKDTAKLGQIDAFCKFLDDNIHLKDSVWNDVIKNISKEW